VRQTSLISVGVFIVPGTLGKPCKAFCLMTQKYVAKTQQANQLQSLFRTCNPFVFLQNPLPERVLTNNCNDGQRSKHRFKWRHS